MLTRAASRLVARRPAGGFTLVELMTALAILAILLAMAAPGYRSWGANTQIRAAAGSVVQGLQAARAEAIKRNARVRFLLAGNHAWTVCTGADEACPEILDSGRTVEARSGGLSISSTIGIGTAVVFDAFGRMALPALPEGATHAAIDIAPAAGDVDIRPVRVVIELGGGVRTCEPGIRDGADPRACPA